MSRAKGQDGRQGRIRAELECALLDMIDCEEVGPFIRLRIIQAMRRAELDDLLEPVITDLDRLFKDIASAKTKVSSAVNMLLE